MGDARGMCISWRVFGDAGQSIFPGLFLAEPFSRCAAPGEAWQNVKTFFRFGNDVSDISQHKPILVPSFWEHGGHFLSSKSVQLDSENKYMRQWVAGKKRGKIADSEAGWEIAQINHYAVRKRLLFDFKKARGRIGMPNFNSETRYNRNYYSQLNLNSDKDTSILRWSQAVADGIERLAQKIKPKLAIAKIIGEGYPEVVMQNTSSNIEESKQSVFPEPQATASAILYRSMHQEHHAEIEKRKYSNSQLAQAIVATLGPQSVVDVGCGIGLLIREIAASGADVLGLEGTWLDEDSMVLASDSYKRLDLEQPFSLDRRFDVCCSIEVAEHLAPERADSFVSNLCSLSDAVVFSAAIGGQGGKGHKNEQWQEYWCKKFLNNGYGTYDPFRNIFRRDPNILPWFQQNVLLFLHDRNPVCEKLTEKKIAPEIANMILPTYHDKIVRRTRQHLRRRLLAERAKRV